MCNQGVQKLGLYEDKTGYKKLCREFSVIFIESTKILLKRDIEHHMEFLYSFKPPTKPG